MREFRGGHDLEKFLTTYHQRGMESSLDYQGARFYDCDIGRFLSLDPLAADFAGWSPYNYVLGNPIIFIDPTGLAPEWIPLVNENNDIVLTAEEGDTQATLIKFLGGKDNADKYLPSYAKNKGLVIQEGAQVKLKDNVYSKAVKGFEENFGDENDKDAVLSYNCHTSCIEGTQGNDFSATKWDEGANLSNTDRDNILMEK